MYAARLLGEPICDSRFTQNLAGDQFIPVAFRSGASMQWEFGRQRKLSSRVGDEGDEDAQADSVSTSQTMIIRIDGVSIIALHSAIALKAARCARHITTP